MTVKIWLIQSKMVERDSEPVLGIYDNKNLLPSSDPDSWSHLALILNDDQKWEIDKNLINELPKDKKVLLTVEMWDTSVLLKTIQGKYDENIRQLFSGILEKDREIYIRWNPEMEVPAGIYAWESIPNLYIESFNTFSGIINEISPSAKMVFSPAGYPGAIENYPGSELVSAASVTINSKSEENTSLYKEKDLTTQIYRKLHRLRFLDHPIFILGSENFNQNNSADPINEALGIIKNNREVIYSADNFRGDQVKTMPEESKLMIGFYDPNEKLVSDVAVSIEHLFFDFNQIETDEFQSMLRKVLQRDNNLIISVEPGMKNNAIDNENILQDILKGEYDNVIKKFYEGISSIDRKIYLRFAHEMEIPVDRYAWQKKDPIEYIKAFRYFMKFPGSEMDNIKRVWGPAGDRGSLEWWPGDDVVDYISISVYGLPDKNITDPEKQESFESIFNRKSRRMRFVNKPFFITEFGVKGDEDFQTKWLLNAAEILNKEPQIVGVCYFNMTDVPDAWGEIKPPEWSISENTFHQFIEKLER